MGFFSSLVGAVVGFFIGGPVGAVIGAGIGATKVGEKIVNTVMDFVLQPFMPSIPDVQGATGEAERQQGVLVQRTGSVQNVPIVYGYRKVAGIVSFAETGASNNKYLYVAYVFSEGLVEGLREVFIDDWQLPSALVGNLNAGQLVNVNADRYNGRVQLRWFPGVYYNNPRTSTVGSTVKGDIFAEAPSFNNSMVYNGLAVLFARYEWKEIKTQEDADNNPFSGNIPEVQVSMLGKRVASLLTDTTETQNYDVNTVRYSTNPAEILLDYLRNPRYGKGLKNSDIDWLTWKRAARKCNQTVTYVASGIQGPILTLNAVIDTGTTIMANTKTLLQNFRGYMPYVQGKYKLRIEDAGNDVDILSGAATIVQTFTKDDIVSDITFNGIERSSKYNVVSVTYVDPDQKFSNQIVVYPETEAERQTYINLDGGRENKYDVTLGHITNYAIAKDFARLIFNKQRRQESCVFTATSKALELEPGDCIRIQSNILNFGTDPWRVVSVKINNNMTVDLGCVRNPDDIYPYVRVGEEDIVLPTYVPKGSIIYFPTSDNRVPLGLVPPVNAIFPPNTTPIGTNPGPTDPNAPGGGGPGGGTGGGPETLPPTDPVPPTNTTPTDPPPPPPFAAVLTVKRSQLVDYKNGTYGFATVFGQPNDGLYSHSIIWWRPNQFTPWTEIRLDTLPGAGGDIPWNLGPLPQGLYEFYARSFATDGRASTQVLRGQLGSRQDLIELGRAGLLGASAITVTAGWTVPQSDVPTEPRYDADIDVLTIRPKLVGGLPTAIRRMTVSLQQITNTLSTPINTLISGVRVYYKYRGDTYYSYEDYKFPADYIAGQVVNFDLTGDFGARIYPSEIIPNTASNTLQYYDFVVRLIYADGTPALKQLAPASAPVEYYLGSYNFVSYGTSTAAAAVVKNQLITSDFNATFKTVDQDPNKNVAVGSDIVPGIDRIASQRQIAELIWTFNSVSNTKFRGFKIRFRPVIPGDNPPFEEFTTGIATNIANQISYKFVSAGFKLNQTYDWVVTAQYTDGTNIKDCVNSLVARAKVLIDDPDYQQLYPKFGFQIKETTLALGELRTAFPGQPVINPRAWIKKIYTPVTTSGTIQEITKTNTQWYLNHWYQLRFQMPNTATAVIVYRREYNPTGAARTTVSNFAKYWTLGAWERVRVPVASLTTDANGWYVLNVRGPVRHDYFESYYQVSGYGTRTSTKYSNIYYLKWPYNSSSGLSDMKPYYGAGNTQVSSAAARWAQYLFVIENASVEETKGVMLREFRVDAVSGVFPQDVDGFISGNVPKDDVVTLSELNTLDAGFDRRLSEAYTGMTFNNLVWNLTQIPSKEPSTNASYNRFINQPLSGDTVY